MQPLIKNGQIVDDSWQLIAADASVDSLPAGDILVPLALWKAESSALKARQGGLGVWLEAGEAVEDIADELDNFQVVALNFPAFTDGRHCSSAYLLRNRYGYKGEVRAFGDVLRDQLFSYHRVGFDAYVLKEGKDPVDALKAFTEFGEVYQASTDQPLPLFRRRG